MAEKKEKNPVWRPTKMSDEIVEKLEEIFKIDGTVEEACSYAGIDTKTYYNWLNSNEEFFHKMEDAKKVPFILARKALIRWMNSKDDRTALKAWVEYLWRRDKRYTAKTEDTHKIGSIDEEDKKLLDEFSKVDEEDWSWGTP